MRRTRFATLAASGVALLLTTAAVAPASAASSGVGTSQASTSILDVALGSVGNALKLNILSDKGQASIDPKVSNPAKAIADLSPLRLASTVVPALNKDVPGLHAETTGAAENTTMPSVDLGSLVPVAGVLGGTLTPPNLSTVVDSNGAIGGINAGLKNFSVLAGLVSIPNAAVSLGAKALTSNANGNRGITVDSLDLVNIGALLRGLGINPANLPLNNVTGLLDALAVTLPVGTQSLNGAGISGLVGQLTNAISGVTSAVGSATGTSPVTLPTNVTGLLGTVHGLLPSVPALPASTDATTANGAVDTLKSQLTNLLNSTLGGLLNSPLLSIKNIAVGLNTKAADTVANSLAGVVAKIGDIKVGLVDLGGVDLGAAASQVSSLVSSVNSQLDHVLSVVGLAGLLKVGLFSQDKQVSQSGGYTHALATLSALSIKLAPPAALSGIVESLLQPTGLLSTVGLNSVSTLLTGPAGNASSAVPVLAPVMQTLNGVLGSGNLGALAGGVSADLLKVASASDFALVGAAPVSPAPVAELPMTGGNHLVFVVGLLFLATGAGLVRWMRVSRSEA